jgi:peptide chain release factor 1
VESAFSQELIVEIQFGEGGEDSKNFVHELFSAYTKYAESLKIKSEVLHSSKGHVIGLFKGKNVGKAFKHESGKHCCQRVPQTEGKGRRHTSVVSVAVLPLPDKTVPLLKESEVEITTTKGTGPGGQHKNKTESAVRVKHLPTKIRVFIDGRDQHSNKREALRILTARVNEFYRSQKQSTYDSKRKKQMGGGKRGDKIRTYNFIKRRVVDHRLGTKTSKVKNIMKGEFGLLGI